MSPSNSSTATSPSNSDATTPLLSSNARLVGSDHSPLEANTLWCAPLQICWEEMAGYFNGGQTLKNLSESAMVDELNAATFTQDMLSDDHYLSYAGPATYDAKAQIEQGITEKFNEKSDILDQLDWSESEADALTLLYAMLFRQFSFEQPFEVLDTADFGSEAKANLSHDVAYFGSYDDPILLEQVRPLFWEDDEHFACQIWTEQDDVLILARGLSGEHFDALWNDLQKRQEAQEQALITSSFVCPNLDLKLQRDYPELAHAALGTHDGQTLEIAQALQTLEFTLDNTGGRIKSEAAIMVETAALIDPVEPLACDFVFDDSFVLFVADGASSGGFYPYMAAQVHDIAEFQS
ncbi:MAG: hypothetical protein IJ125_01400 [Atopobiaceae bacterium]|nr:hypothetical protein [Atopobiaceae bacterium]